MLKTVATIGKLVIANWKMNGSMSLLQELAKISVMHDNRDVIVCPPYPYLYNASKLLPNSFRIGAQNCSENEEGAHTGEISAKILADVNCSHVIIGHSEMRAMIDTDEKIAAKFAIAVKYGLIPILCVGEKSEDKNTVLKIVEDQINYAIGETTIKDKIVIAYEPIWAIGGVDIPSVDYITNVCGQIKSTIENKGIKAHIVYGGSVKKNNLKKIIAIDEIDGVMIGGASLNIDEFSAILSMM